MLHELIAANQDLIAQRVCARVDARIAPLAVGSEIADGIPVLLAQLVEALREERSAHLVARQHIVACGARYGNALLLAGLPIAQVVLAYGDVCQTITQLATEAGLVIPADEFRIFNRCLDEAIDGAVTAYAHAREEHLAEHGTARLVGLGRDVRSVVDEAVRSFESIQRGKIAARGSTATMHGRSLEGVLDLIERALTDDPSSAAR
ncbi:MAG: hypothetical protein HOO96_30525 [Polyangiaceae bacterium]|nr:hypothetical protein [Polyangiaceae bacterium]